tara:strand:- start:7542 stop:7898 length:357 start_codon:yes stop_codon:yes gene_type:complete
MKEELISFETAKLAKEKGFEIEQSYYYDKGGETWSFHTWTEGLPYPEASFAPTQSLLQKWLREKHDINVMGSATVNVWFFHSEYISTGHVITSTSKQSYGTYEEAIEAGLYETLKVIA